MKVLSASVFLLFFCVMHISASEITGYTAKKIASNTYVIHGPLEYPNKKNKGFMNNPGFVITNSGVVVIDPGSSVQVGRMVLKQIKALTKNPVTHVFNTHIHGDHWLGNQAFSEAYPKVTILAHPEMLKRAKEGAGKQWVALMSKSTEGATNGTSAIFPNRVIKNKESIKIDGVQFRIHAPKAAHSFTDIMIEVVDESVVFLGDNVLYERLPRMDDATFSGNIKACQIAIGIKAKTYVPGHGLSGGNEVVKPFMNYLKIIHTNVGRFYEAGMTDFEMKPKILLKLQKYFKWAGFNDEMGKHVSLAVLEYERDSF